MRHAPVNRRRFLQTAGAGLTAGLALNPAGPFSLSLPAMAQEAGGRPPKPPAGVRVINPRGRVPVSLIIDDSTCLVNLAHFGIPQFHEVFPDQYPQPWKTLPREIPDAFVRRFGEWCAARGIKGKYSLIPHPACVGWLDRDLPGWSKQDLQGQPGARPHFDDTQLGYSPGDDQPYVGNRHENRASVSGADLRLHGKLGLQRRQVGR